MKIENKVQCFYNVNYNEGGTSGHSRFAYGFGWFDIVSDNAILLEKQIQTQMEINGNVAEGTTYYNFNVVSFTPFPQTVFEYNGEEGE